MNTSDVIREISRKVVDIDSFVKRSIMYGEIREEIVHHLLTNPHIMVYYHCYYVVSKASRKRPDLFYRHWHDIVALLKHRNSYHRDIALTIIAELTRVDHDNLFAQICDDYFVHVNDEKFMTGQCCVRNSAVILKNKSELREHILDILMDVDHRCDYTRKQKELLKCDVLEAIAVVYDTIDRKAEADAFINGATESASPKTRRKARELAAKYGIRTV